MNPAKAAFLLVLAANLTSHAQLSKGNEILIDRGLQVVGLVQPDDVFNLETYSDAHYSSVLWTWSYASDQSSWKHMSRLGSAPGFPWGRWAGDESAVPLLEQEGPYMSQLILLQLGDEWFLDEPSLRDRAANWFDAVRSDYPGTLIYMNNYGGQVSDGNLFDFAARAQPDMLCFDTYPWRSVYDTTQPGSIGAPISGPPTHWYGELRRYRDISKAFAIPFGSYNQTFASVEHYGGGTVYRHPTPSELRLNMFAALAFNAKVLIDFTYNSGASSLFDRNAEGQWAGDSLPNPLYHEKADANLRARNLGQALVRLKPVADATTACDATTPWTTSITFIRGQNAAGHLNPIPINFCAGAGGTNPYTDWAVDRNDPFLRSWSVSNPGTVNDGKPGDVILSWFTPLDKSFDGPAYSAEKYLMVVNGLTDTSPGSTAANCLQEITLRFHSSLAAVEMLNPLTGMAELQLLPLKNGLRELVFHLNGGDAALLKFTTGAPFVGVESTSMTGPPVITIHPPSRETTPGAEITFSVHVVGSPSLHYQWQFDGENIGGATANTFTLTDAQQANAGSYTVVVGNSFGTATSMPAVLTVVSAQPFFYEPFAYSNVGGPVSGNEPANWTFGGTGPNDLNVTSGSLSYPGLAASMGNSVTNGGDGLGVRRLFGTSITSGTMYFSALFRIIEMGAWNGASSSIGALTAPNNTAFRLSVMVKKEFSRYVIGVQKGGAGVSPVFDTNEYQAGETVFLVGRYDFNESPNTVSLWINPDASTFGAVAPPAGFISATMGTDGFAIDRFNMRQNTEASVPAAMQWDELRVGNTWRDVTPFAPPPPTLLKNVTQLSEGRFLFSFSSRSAQNGSVYASTDLINWLFVSGITEIEPGLYQFIDDAAADHRKRFYQVRWP